MKVAFHLAHPAHFHLFKKTIQNLIDKQHKVVITFNDKDVLGDLIKDSNLQDYSFRIHAIKNVDSSLALRIQFIQKIFGVFYRYLKFRPKIVLGTSVIISLVGRILKYKSIIVNEDDFDIIQQTVDLGYPFASNILCPSVCRVGNFEGKCIKYESYHELAYLHPDNFKPDCEVVKKYFPVDKPYFLIRFAKLTAHHDAGIKGITDELAMRIIKILEPNGSVYITSERHLEPEFEKYRMKIDPLDIHHIMAFASIYIGDSQTMAAEAGVLGVPFVRFNDFVGRIGYLRELEEKYKLGYGIKPSEPDYLLQVINDLVRMENRSEIFKVRQSVMLKDKIKVTEFMVWLIENYPESIRLLKENPEYSMTFK